jgi:hypothetical protein
MITSPCCEGAGVRSLFGLRPGLGFAGITHSLEAKKNIEKEKKKVDSRANIPVAHNVEEEEMTGDGG